MANEDKILLEINNLRKYFPVKGNEGPGCTGGTGCFFLHQKGRDPWSG